MGFKQDDVLKAVISKDPCGTEQQSSRTLCDAGNGLYLCCSVGWPQSWSEILFYLFFWLHGLCCWRLGLLVRGTWDSSWTKDRGRVPCTGR